MKLHVKKGDMVQVIAGDDKGKIAKVLKVIPEKVGRCFTMDAEDAANLYRLLHVILEQ